MADSWMALVVTHTLTEFPAPLTLRGSRFFHNYGEIVQGGIQGKVTIRSLFDDNNF